jgi:3-deoxy-7-phosphoheptulonate synthase
MTPSLCNVKPLPSPAALVAQYSLSSSARQRITATRRRVVDRFATGQGPAVAIVGPCSIHDRVAALDYAERLRKLQTELGDDVLLIMRAYFEKPRTSVGWKGFLYDPDLDGSDDLQRGLTEARRLLVDLAELGVPTATELLEPLTAPYLADTLSWAAIGARTTESQPHRQLASSLPLPVGFKNGTDGSVDAAVCAVVAARARHSLVGVDGEGRLSVLESLGNPAAHVVLRGGKSGPNYDRASVLRASTALREVGVEPAVVVDCSHGNSGKDHRRQPAVARAVVEQLSARVEGLGGLMLESHLVAGRQDLGATSLVYGQSVTDACIDFETTAALLRELARAVKPRASVMVRAQVEAPVP